MPTIYRQFTDNQDFYSGNSCFTQEVAGSNPIPRTMSEIFDKHGDFRRLHSFTLATIVQLDTLRFCRQFLTSNPREAETRAEHIDPALKSAGGGDAFGFVSA